MREVDRLLFVARFQFIRREIERFRRAAAGTREPRERYVMQLNRAQSRRARAGLIRGSLQNVELRSESGGEI